MAAEQTELIRRYFGDLTEEQVTKFGMLEPLYREWNDKINVISRKDIDNLYIHHVLHSLAIAKFMRFVPDTQIVDLGTGGGFPGIPLAILFPECRFSLVDSVRKKITVVEAVAEALQLQNVTPRNARIEEIRDKFDFVVTRAVAKVDVLLPWARKVLSPRHKNMYPNGLIALKGDVREELRLLPKYEYREVMPVTDYFDEPYFEGKFLLYVQG